ncbi:MAG: hypothetical protein KIG60_03660 [Caryophanon sp.]|nr:hypothetical protein [Caryophanon sp.]
MPNLLNKIIAKFYKQKQPVTRHTTTLCIPRRTSTLNVQLTSYYERLDANDLSGVEMYTLGELVERYMHECAVAESREIITYFKDKMYMTTGPAILQTKLQAVRPYIQ